MGVAFRPEMPEDDRDQDDRKVPTQRDREIDVAFFALALFFGCVIVFVLLFG